MILHDDLEIAERIMAIFTSNAMVASICDDGDMALAAIYNDLPDLLVARQTLPPNASHYPHHWHETCLFAERIPKGIINKYVKVH